jgi:hypothetical protein
VVSWEARVKTDTYRERLRELEDWEPFLLAESGLPGPRGNIELARAVAQEGNEEIFERFLGFDSEKAPTNSPYEFLAFCGTLGLGELLVEGNREVVGRLRACASDPRWRTREAVAMAFQRWGEVDMESLLQEMSEWSRGGLLERRAAVAALCEPRLLHDAEDTARVLDLLDAVTASVAQVEDRHSEEFKALRKGLAYCWSVAVAALPEVGTRKMEQWLESSDRDVRWIMKENLRKKRLMSMDAEWVAMTQKRLGA